jgi:mitochondrial-processing peptidase subunit alpha
MLGSASSFSSGGPGKGMHSRCTKNMLNKEPCIESASFLLSHYDHFGLFGLTAAGPNDAAGEVVETVLREILLLREVTDAELDRVKNMLVGSIYANIERQSDRL